MLWAHRHSYQRLMVHPATWSDPMCPQRRSAHCFTKPALWLTVLGMLESVVAMKREEKDGCIYPSSSVVSSESRPPQVLTVCQHNQWGFGLVLFRLSMALSHPFHCLQSQLPQDDPYRRPIKIHLRRPDKRKREEKEEKSASVRLDKGEALLTDWRIFSQRMFWMRAFSAPGSNAISPG